MVDYPKISIITPSFNQGQYIGQTIESVLDQGYPNLEYLIYDGGSTDNTVAVLEKYAKHLTHWESTPDGGQSDAINKGLQRASGQVVNWLNSDDYYAPGALLTVGGIFAEHPNTQVLCGRSHIVADDGSVLRKTTGTDVYEGNLTKTIGWLRIDQPETFFSKTAIDRMGPLNADFHLVMDKEWWMRYLFLFGLSRIAHLDKVLVNFRHHDDSKTMTQADAFALETNKLFYNLAQAIGATKIAEGIAALEMSERDLMLQLPAKRLVPAIVEQALHYFMLYQADRHYYLNKDKVARNCLALIDPFMLYPEDKELFDKLMQRSRWLPATLRKLVKRP